MQELLELRDAADITLYLGHATANLYDCRSLVKLALKGTTELTGRIEQLRLYYYHIIHYERSVPPPSPHGTRDATHDTRHATRDTRHARVPRLNAPCTCPAGARERGERGRQAHQPLRHPDQNLVYAYARPK